MPNDYKMLSVDKVLEDNVEFYLGSNDADNDVYNDVDDDEFEAESQIT